MAWYDDMSRQIENGDVAQTSPTQQTPEATEDLFASDVRFAPGSWPEQFFYNKRAYIRTSNYRLHPTDGDVLWVAYRRVGDNVIVKVFND